MEKPYFVMMWDQGRESARPIVDENDDVIFWPSYYEARQAMVGHIAESFGFCILNMDEGT